MCKLAWKIICSLTSICLLAYTFRKCLEVTKLIPMGYTMAYVVNGWLICNKIKKLRTLSFMGAGRKLYRGAHERWRRRAGWSAGMVVSFPAWGGLCPLPRKFLSYGRNRAFWWSLGIKLETFQFLVFILMDFCGILRLMATQVVILGQLGLPTLYRLAGISWWIYQFTETQIHAIKLSVHWDVETRLVAYIW